jgi:hypothetical protein
MESVRGIVMSGDESSSGYVKKAKASSELAGPSLAHGYTGHVPSSRVVGYSGI